jgi:hypothetical protein
LFVCRSGELIVGMIERVVVPWIVALGWEQIWLEAWLLGLLLFLLILLLSSCKPEVLSKL